MRCRHAGEEIERIDRERSLVRGTQARRRGCDTLPDEPEAGSTIEPDAFWGQQRAGLGELVAKAIQIILTNAATARKTI
jgi:hypothetical protein